MRKTLRRWIYKNFRFKLSFGIPFMVTTLVATSGIVLISFLRNILKTLSFTSSELQQINQILTFVIITYGGSVLFACVVAILITLLITKPIERLIDKAKEIGSGNFSYDSDALAYDEFSVLEKAFNDMARGLDEYRRRLEEYSHGLEGKVKERTYQLEEILDLSKEMISLLERGDLARITGDRISHVVNYRLCGLFYILEEPQFVLRINQPLKSEEVTAFKEKFLSHIRTFPEFKYLDKKIPVEIEEKFVSQEYEEDIVSSVFFAPLISGAKLIGFLGVGSSRPHPVEKAKQNVILLVANHLATALQTTQVYSHLKEIDKMKSDFISTVSHELRTPLTAIKEGVDLLSYPEFGQLSDKQRGFLDIVRRNSDRLYHLINELLDLSRLESGKVEFHRAKIDLVELTRDTLKRMTLPFNNKSITVEAKYPQNLPAAYADANQISRVLTNLLGNAVKYTPEGKRVKVEFLAQETHVGISIMSEGDPLDKDKLKKVFDKFYQVKAAQANVKGSGLGLAISKEIIQISGGNIWAESSSGFNKFNFTIPAFSPQALLSDSLKHMIEDTQEKKLEFSAIIFQLISSGAPFGADALNETVKKLSFSEDIDGSIFPYGGDSFVIVSFLNKQEGNVVGQKIKNKLFKDIGETKSSLGEVNFAVVSYPEDGLNSDELFTKINGFLGEEETK